MPLDVIYFSSTSENTARFVHKLESSLPGLPVTRLPLRRSDPEVIATKPYILITPTYGGGGEAGGAVPKQVIRFLNVKANRDLLRGVISMGNTNFGSHYCRAGDIIAAKTGVPHLDRVEVFGTPADVERVAGLLSPLDMHDRA